MKPNMGATVEWLSPDDFTELACDVGPAPMQIAAILILDGGSALEPPAVVDAIADRIRSIPRLRQRLVRTPAGCGRPVWIDDPHFDIRQHVHCVPCPAPGDDQAALAVAARTVARRLPTDRPLWSATLVTGLAHRRAALVLVLHHVVADGIGGLAVLAGLVDGAATVPYPGFPRPAPSWRQLFTDAMSARLRAAATLPSSLRRLRVPGAERGPAGTAAAPVCSLNRPTGPRRHPAVTSADLTAVRSVAHAYDATVNDVLLTAVTGALHTLLLDRGERADGLVISIPATARREATATQLGNRVGVIPVRVPTGGDPRQRLQTVAAITRTHKGAARNTTVLGPAFRILARLGLFGPFISRQRMITTFVTNLRGPEHRLSLLGTPISDIYPVAVVPGNVTVAFAALSYANTLTITVTTDPDRCPDLPVLVRHLHHELDALTTAQSPVTGRRSCQFGSLRPCPDLP